MDEEVILGVLFRARAYVKRLLSSRKGQVVGRRSPIQARVASRWPPACSCLLKHCLPVANSGKQPEPGKIEWTPWNSPPPPRSGWLCFWMLCIQLAGFRSLRSPKHGHGSKLNHQETAGFSPCFHVPGFHFGATLFLTHSHISGGSCTPPSRSWRSRWGHMRRHSAWRNCWRLGARGRSRCSVLLCLAVSFFCFVLFCFA